MVLAELLDFHWVICVLMLLLGCVVQTAIGFGMSVVSAPVIIMIEPLWVPYVLTFNAMVLSVVNAWHHRLSFDLRAMLPAFVTRVPGTALGIWVLAIVSVVWLQFFVAVFVLLAVVVTAKAEKFHSTPWRMSVAGFFSGFMGTTTSIGGPPMALIMQHGVPQVVRGNLAIYFLYSCVLSLLAYLAMGLFSWQLFWLSLTTIPTSLLGFWIGKFAHAHINQVIFRRCLLVMCTITAFISLFGSIRSLF